MSRRKAPSAYTRDMIHRIEEAGGEVRPGRRGGHWKVYYEGRLIASLPATPSDWRSELNDIAQMRRAGLPIAKRKDRNR